MMEYTAFRNARPRGFRLAGLARALRRRRELFDRHQDILHFALHVGRRAIPALTQQPRDFPHRLAGTLIGYAVNHDDGDAIGRAHRRICLAGPAGFDEFQRGPEQLEILFVIGCLGAVDLDPLPGAAHASGLKRDDVVP